MYYISLVSLMASSSTSPNPLKEYEASHEEDEETIIIFNDNDVEEGLSECVKSVVGKIITEKPIYKNSVLSALANIWCKPKWFSYRRGDGKNVPYVF